MWKAHGMLLGLLLAGCSGTDESDPEPRAGGASATGAAGRASEPRVAEGPLFGSLVTRHGTITTRLGDEGPLFTVVAPDGTTLASDVDAAHLEVHFPELHALVEGTLDEGGAYAGRDESLHGDLGYQE